MTKKTSKTKASKAKSPPAKSIEEAQLHEPIIQDRIAGLTIADLARKHGKHRDSISDILKANEERIKTERGQLMRDRQEAINKAMEDDIENLTTLVTEGTDLMLRTIRALSNRIEAAEKNGKPLSNSMLIMAADAVTKAFDKIRSVALAQQKEAAKE